MVHIKSKIVTSSMAGLTINDTKETVSINVNKTTNNTKYHIVKI